MKSVFPLLIFNFAIATQLDKIWVWLQWLINNFNMDKFVKLSFPSKQSIQFRDKNNFSDKTNFVLLISTKTHKT